MTNFQQSEYPIWNEWNNELQLLNDNLILYNETHLHTLSNEFGIREMIYKVKDRTEFLNVKPNNHKK